MMRLQLPLIGLALLLWAIAGIINSSFTMPKLKIDKQESAKNFNPKAISLMSIGNKMLAADLMWIVTLLESDLEHYGKADLGSWLYLRFLSIVSLDPRFYQAYNFGGQYLLVAKDDVAGAESLLLRGHQVYPNDYHMNYFLGYIYALEYDTPQKAIPYFEKIAKDPKRPPNFNSLFAKVMSSALQLEDALSFSIEALRQTPQDNPMYERLRSNIYSLQAEIDLTCLNSQNAMKPCRKIDYFGSPYIKSNGEWQASHPWRAIRLSRRKRSNGSQ